jgi:integrase/recombinase XerD
MTGRVAECPVDEMNRPGGRPGGAADPSVSGAGGGVVRGVAGGATTCRKFAPAARSYAAARLMAE